MNVNSKAQEGKRAISSPSLPKVTRDAANNDASPGGQVKRRIEIVEPPVLDADELQMAGYFVIPLRQLK